MLILLKITLFSVSEKVTYLKINNLNLNGKQVSHGHSSYNAIRKAYKEIFTNSFWFILIFLSV